MRRNRGGPGGSGSVSFLSRALKCRESDLTAAFTALGLTLAASGGETPPPLEIDGSVWWLNQDQRGGVWINGKEAKPAGASQAQPAGGLETKPVDSNVETAANSEAPLGADHPAAPVPEYESRPAATNPVFAAVRLLLKETRTGAVAGETGRLAEALGKTPEEFLAVLTGAGLKVPEKPREKPVFVEHAGEIFWLNKNAKDQLWLNAKASKFADGAEDESGTEAKPRRGRSRAPMAAGEPTG